MSETHALYRFFDQAGALLYIGVTADPGARWRTHRRDKPWWHEVANITIEIHESRAAVLEAERQAILDEKPKHNVVHNRGGRNDARPTPQLDRLAPIQVGDWIALGLRDGRCPVGEVVALDDVWVGVRLKEFMWGTLTDEVIAERWSDVVRVELAYPEDATEDKVLGHPREMHDDHLGKFQTGWHRIHQPDGDPVHKAYVERERELDRGAL